MTTRKTDKMEQCQLCKRTPKDVYYDAPTEAGPWANMCEDCMLKQPYTQLGTRFELRTEKKESVSGILKGKELSSMEEAFDGDREIGCPNCGEARLVEPDADYTYECEGCGSKVRVPCLM